MADTFMRTGLLPENERRRAVEREIRRITAEKDAQNDEFTGKLVGTILICAVLDVAAVIFLKEKITEVWFFLPLIFGNIAMFFWRFSKKKEGEAEEWQGLITFVLRLGLAVVIAGIATAVVGAVVGLFMAEPIATVGGVFAGQAGYDQVHFWYYLFCGVVFVGVTAMVFINQLGPPRPPR